MKERAKERVTESAKEQANAPVESQAAEREPEAYFDIVWKQFKKNRFALAALWGLPPLFLLAIFAPVIASQQPFVYDDGSGTVFPWFRALFHPEEPVDFAFNMCLLGFFPWLITSAAFNWDWKKNRVPGRKRIGRVAWLFVGFTIVPILFFGLTNSAPNNIFRQRSFNIEQYRLRNEKQVFALYPPIPFGPTEQDLDSRFQAPGYTKPHENWMKSNDHFIHLFGTDNAGRDVFVQMIYGTRISLTVGFVAVGLYLNIGIVIGAVAGYFGGKVDALICRLIEVILLFPSFFLILTLVALIGPSIYIIMTVIGITGWPTIARLIRGEVLKQRGNDYVSAARGLGASHFRIIFRHILPNAISPALVAAPFGIAGAIITEAGLSLLGFGVRPPTPSWGTLLRLGNDNYAYWWLVVIPSIAMFFTVTMFNLVGGGLRDAMDPRLRA